MKRILFVISLLITGLITSCEKEDKCSTGTIIVNNTSVNSYYISINGNYTGVAPGGKSTEFTVDKGNVDLKAEQAAGYILYPTIKEGFAWIEGCDIKYWDIP